MNQNRFWMLTALVGAAALARLIPHPPNFTPVGAIALFGAACFADRRLAFGIPLVAMLLSDLLLGALFYGWGTFNAATPAVYGAFLLCGAIGLGLRRGRTPWRIGGASVGAAVVFFAVTNFAVWLTSGMYPLNAGGLAACFAAAIPFFGNTLAGHLVFSAVLFGALAGAEHQVPALRPTAA